MARGWWVAIAVVVVAVAGEPAAQAACAPGVPAAACVLRDGLRACAASDRDRLGEWRYALIAAIYDPIEELSTADLTAAWQRGEIAATAETAQIVNQLLGPGAPQLLVDGAPLVVEMPRPRRAKLPAGQSVPPRLAIVPADQLMPLWKAVAIDGRHPLEPVPNALALPLCAAGGSRTAVRNIWPDKLTSLAITGVTALTRLTAVLMEHKGATYPIRDVEPWLAGADLVHISNEVSFVTKGCKPRPSTIPMFCSQDSYIKLLEAAHAKIIELDGSHLPDYGRSWISHTLDLYSARGWVWFGGGRDQLDATAPRIIEHHGNRLGFLGCNMVWTTGHVISEGPGVAACDLERMKWQVGELLRAGIVPIVSIQHEEVYHHDPPDSLVHDLRSLAAAGAVFVNGSQAHCAHPWEVHRGGYVHYGGGNFLFDQQAINTQDATLDKLYIHAGVLLSVGHLYTRLEEFGKPRPMTPRERTGYLAEMASVLAKLPHADPTGAPVIVPASRSRPDSLLVGLQLSYITVTVPAELIADQQYPLVIDFKAAGSDDGAFVVTVRRTGEPATKLIPAITKFMIAKYAIDPDRVSVRR